MISPNWYNTLHSDFAKLHHIGAIEELATALNYPYYMWNGRIYTTADMKDTGITVRDLPPLARS